MGFTDSDAVYGTKLKTQGAIKEFEKTKKIGQNALLVNKQLLQL